jgi:hypothetical protein
MPVHAFFDAYVEVDGGRLAEFDVETDMNDEGVPRATCWIPSEAGKVRTSVFFHVTMLLISL